MNRQRWSHPQPAGSGNHRAYRKRPWQAFPGDDLRIRHALLYPDRCRRHSRAEEPAEKTLTEAVTATELAGEPITAKLTRAPGNDAPNRRWRRHRRTESRLDKRLVCRASFRDGKHLQTLGLEPAERRASGLDRRASEGDRQPLSCHKMNRFCTSK